MKTLSLLVFVCSLCFLPFNNTQAVTITHLCTLDPGNACTLGELINTPDAYIDIDGVRFQNFDQLFFPDPDLIRVGALDSIGSGLGSSVGLSFTPIDPSQNLLAAFTSTPEGFSASSPIFYEIEVLSGLPLGASNLQVFFGDFRNNGGAGLDGGLSVNIFRPDGQVVQTALCSDVSNTSCADRTATDNQTFGPSHSLSIVDDLFIEYDAFTRPHPDGDGMEILRFNHAFTRVPIPTPHTVLLMSFGLLWLPRIRRTIRVSDHTQKTSM